jgi:competence protein ComEA
VSLFCIAIAIIILIATARPTSPIEFSSDTGATVSGAQTQEIWVDVAGAVVAPGVYRLPRGSRVEDAIAAAGGLSSEADSEAIARVINRAAKVSDGAKLYIPKTGSAQTEATTGQTQTTKSTGVSVNAASQSELETLSGIGPVTAKKIIDARPYLALEELVSKKAMSQSLFDKLKDQITL